MAARTQLGLRRLSILIGLALAMAALPAFSAHAEDSTPIVETEWDGPTVHLDWAGQAYTSEEVSFIGTRTFSPGDKATRTVQIRNNSTADAVVTLEATIWQEYAEESYNPRLAEDVYLGWNIEDISERHPFASFLASEPPTRLVRLPLKAGEATALTMTADMPSSVSTHTRQGQRSTQLSFDVTLRVQEDLPSRGGSVLAVTGANIALVAGVAVLLLCGGLLGRRYARERRATTPQ